MFPDFLGEPVEVVAERLLGCFFVSTIDGQRVVVRIVETEAYDEDDPASHTYRGRTRRNEVMFGENGHLYVYFTYGMHHCFNVVTGESGYGSAVLIRGGEPIEGFELIEQRRGVSGTNATNGPAKLCQALSVDLGFGGHDLRHPPLRLERAELLAGETVVRTTRIGISKAADLPRRFYIAGNRYVSKPWTSG